MTQDDSEADALLSSGREVPAPELRPSASDGSKGSLSYSSARAKGARTT